MLAWDSRVGHVTPEVLGPSRSRLRHSERTKLVSSISAATYVGY